VTRPELDEQRWGGFLDGSWGRPFDGGRVAAELGAGWTRVEAIEADETFSRTVASTRLSGQLRRTRGSAGWSASLLVDGALGNTGGGFWRQFSVAGRASGITGIAALGLSARYGDSGGAPTRFDLFRIGGADSAIWAPGLDRNRVFRPALPAAIQLGSRLESWGADLAFSAVPLVLYAERLRAWSPPAAKPEMVRLAGAELRFERLLPPELSESFSLYVGVAWIRSDAPAVKSTQGYGGLIYRP
jgi:hypothetical protein